MKAIILILFFLTVSCSNDDGPIPGCYQEESRNRRIIHIIKEATGTMLGQQCGDGSFLLDPDSENQSGPLGQFYPCNLLEEFQVDGVRVVFSGYLYESFDTEDICADLFEITEIRLADQ
ncbi:hypothetical protein [Arenibacter algicola]|uniref:Lipoprotein n=1 Tax=Arenibacter algicola TaxID=616991 RepID=A0A221UZF6_9FLAO|nr:hypothetical protein [Arenibacter algicola]ASO06271.1 hypothetical protein AREALGSMS7_02833 [Arenibacter algicola]